MCGNGKCFTVRGEDGPTTVFIAGKRKKHGKHCIIGGADHPTSICLCKKGACLMWLGALGIAAFLLGVFLGRRAS